MSILALLLYSLSLYAQDSSSPSQISSVPPSPDFDGSGTVDITDFLLFADHFGTSHGDAKYDAKYDLDSNGAIEITDFLIFVENFGKTITPSTDDSTVDAAFARLNEGRKRLGLNQFKKAVEGDSDFVPIRHWIIGCYEELEQHEDLRDTDIEAIGLTPIPGGSECALRLETYHYVPDSTKVRVERSVWECFSQSNDIRATNNVSCGGRYSFIDGHVKWLPAEVFYTIEQGAALGDKFRALIPWIEEKLKIKVYEAESAQKANLFLHLGAESVGICPERYGCNTFSETFATIYISAPDAFFNQVLKHELLHALLPMGHLPAANYLMSVRPSDPSQTHTLTPLEEKLLVLYTHPYLRDGMTMEKFQKYLIIE